MEILSNITSVKKTDLQSLSYLGDKLNFVPSGTVNVNGTDVSVIDDNNDIINIPNHGLSTGDMIYYETGTGTYSRPVTQKFGFEASGNGIDTANDTIKLSFPDNLAAGDLVTYHASDHTSITGLVDGTQYQVLSVVDCSTEEDSCALVKLTTVGGSTAIDLGTIINDSTNGDGHYTPIHTLVRTVTVTGLGDTPVNGLQGGNYYYVVRIDKDRIKLAETYDEAMELAYGVPLYTDSRPHLWRS